MAEPVEQLIILDSVESTNNYAMGLARSGMGQHGLSVLAHEQTKGKGRRSRHWLSAKGEGINLSIIADCRFLPVYRQFDLSMAISLACCSFIEEIASVNVLLKWPNDIYIHDKKAGGILIENILKGSVWQWAIIGIGLNINQSDFPPQAGNPVSLKMITGDTYNIEDLGRALQLKVLKSIAALEHAGSTSLLQQYNDKLFKKGEQVTLRKGNIAFPATIEGVSFDGELLTSGTVQQSFSFDEVEWVLQ
jgi:BirA family transcriptional regulator, biotin operon repressor / biotin---[acetyl-CoA-carboxylase] ligase